MANVYTKNEILQELSSKGYFIDEYTLDTFFKKWKIEAIFEDEQGCEFFDENALDTVLNEMFNDDNKKEEKKDDSSNIDEQNVKILRSQSEIQKEREFENQFNIITPNEPKSEYKVPSELYDNLTIQDEPITINDRDTNDILNNISLSDGTPLMRGVSNNPQRNNFYDINLAQSINEMDLDVRSELEAENPKPKKEKKMGILEGAFLASGKEFNPPNSDEENSENQNQNQDDTNNDFDDISLLSESLEAQEKFREYVMSEFARRSPDGMPQAPAQNAAGEFKLDISERTLSMIARSMAKKIAKHVNSLCSADMKNSQQVAQIEQKNEELEKKNRELEEQNKKLRLLLAESNKNLNSYKPSVFGLYKKVPPQN